MKGIDISSWQRGMPAESLNAAGFAICKISEGTYFTDTAFDEFYAEATIPLGAYVFSRATTEQAARAEAKLALELLQGRPLPLGVYMDVEDPGQLTLDNWTLTAVCKAFCDTIRAAGYIPGVYGSELGAWWKLRPEGLGDVIAWVANWSSRPAFGDLWQYSDKEHIQGFGPVDGDEAISERMLELIRGEATPEQAPPAEDTFTVSGIPALRKGDTGDAVKVMQGELIALGYRCGGVMVYTAEKPDGIFGNVTEESVRSFQRSKNLPDTGIVDQATRAAMLT